MHVVGCANICALPNPVEMQHNRNDCVKHYSAYNGNVVYARIWAVNVCIALNMLLYVLCYVCWPAFAYDIFWAELQYVDYIMHLFGRICPTSFRHKWSPLARNFVHVTSETRSFLIAWRISSADFHTCTIFTLLYTTLCVHCVYSTLCYFYITKSQAMILSFVYEMQK